LCIEALTDGDQFSQGIELVLILGVVEISDCLCLIGIDLRGARVMNCTAVLQLWVRIASSCRTITDVVIIYTSTTASVVIINIIVVIGCC
jgi:hypothetical protein